MLLHFDCIIFCYIVFLDLHADARSLSHFNIHFTQLNSSIASASGFLTWTFMEFAYHSKFSAVGAAMGTVAGLVTITPACGYVSPMSAVAIASIGAISSFYGIRLKTYLGADDALDVFACHGVGI